MVRIVADATGVGYIQLNDRNNFLFFPRPTAIVQASVDRVLIMFPDANSTLKLILTPITYTVLLSDGVKINGTTFTGSVDELTTIIQNYFRGNASNTSGSGTKGDTGATGMSAYESAKAAGFVGTEAEWLASLKGTGVSGKQVEFQKTATYIQWRYVGDASWTNLIPVSDLKGNTGNTGSSGQTAFQLAQQLGYNGTEAQWIASLKGSTGDRGPQGTSGSANTRTVRVSIPGNIASLAVSSLTVTWPTAFVDTLYNIKAQFVGGGVSLGNVLVVDQIKDITATGCTVDIKNVSLSAFANANVKLHVTAIHD